MLPRPTLTTYGVTEIPLSVKAAVDLFQDIESVPSFSPNVLSVEIISGKPKEVGVGFHWREVRRFQGRTLIMHKTVTELHADPFTVKVNVSLKENGCLVNRATETFNISIHPIDDMSCNVLWAMGSVAGGFFGTIYAAFCGKCIIASLHNHLAAEMDCYAKEAKRRESSHEDGTDATSDEL